MCTSCLRNLPRNLVWPSCCPSCYTVARFSWSRRSTSRQRTHPPWTILRPRPRCARWTTRQHQRRRCLLWRQSSQQSTTGTRCRARWRAAGARPSQMWWEEESPHSPHHRPHHQHLRRQHHRRRLRQQAQGNRMQHMSRLSVSRRPLCPRRPIHGLHQARRQHRRSLRLCCGRLHQRA